MFVEWVDIGAQWDNIPGEDNLPGYHEDVSKRLAKIAAAEVKKEIRDPKRAFDVRCTECHNYDYMNKAKPKKKTEAEWRHSIDRMVKKRPTWIHKSELPIITEYVLTHYFVAGPIADPKRAFTVRCTTCHDCRCMDAAKAKKKTKDAWTKSIDRMAKKRPSWIHKSELPLITRYALANYFQAGKK